jgi:hypothetical protein
MQAMIQVQAFQLLFAARCRVEAGNRCFHVMHFQGCMSFGGYLMLQDYVNWLKKAAIQETNFPCLYHYTWIMDEWRLYRNCHTVIEMFNTENEQVLH